MSINVFVAWCYHCRAGAVQLNFVLAEAWSHQHVLFRVPEIHAVHIAEVELPLDPSVVGQPDVFKMPEVRRVT